MCILDIKKACDIETAEWNPSSYFNELVDKLVPNGTKCPGFSTPLNLPTFINTVSLVLYKFAPKRNFTAIPMNVDTNVVFNKNNINPSTTPSSTNFVEICQSIVYEFEQTLK